MPFACLLGRWLWAPEVRWAILRLKHNTIVIRVGKATNSLSGRLCFSLDITILFHRGIDGFFYNIGRTYIFVCLVQRLEDAC